MLKPMRIQAAAFSLLLPAMAAADDIVIVNPDQSDFRSVATDLIQTLDYKALGPAEPGGLTGFSIGGFGAYVPVSDEGAWQRLTGLEVEELGLAGVRVTKGLPGNLDVGAYYSAIPKYDVSAFGAELRYAILEGSAVSPAVALRGTYAEVSGIDDFDLSSWGVDISASKGFAFITPYIGAGYVRGTADPAVVGLGKETINAEKFYAGARIAAVFLQITPEISVFDGNTAYALSLGLGF